MDATKTLIQAFTACRWCRLDYCNSLLYGMSSNLLQKTQSVQIASTRLVTGTGRCEHITTVLQKLHWLPRSRIQAGCTSRCLDKHWHKHFLCRGFSFLSFLLSLFHPPLLLFVSSHSSFFSSLSFFLPVSISFSFQEG